MEKSKKTGLLFIFLAVILALGAVAISYASINRITRKVPMLIVKEDVEIEIGDPLKEEMFKKVEVPIGGRPKDAVPIDAKLDSYVALRDMGPKDILRYANIVDTKEVDSPILSSRLKYLENTADFKQFPEDKMEEEIAKMRVAEIPITSILGALPGMKVGDKIAVTSVYAEDILDEDNKATSIRRTETIFDHIYVIGIKKPSDKSKGSLIIALTQRQFEALALAREKGKFYIAVMPYGIKKPEGHMEILSRKYVEMLDNPENTPLISQTQAELEKGGE